MKVTSPLLRAYVAESAVPLRLWLGPAAARLLDHNFERALLGPVELIFDPLDRSPEELPGPAVVVLTPADLRGDRAPELLQLCRRAAPGRPLLFGRSDDRDLLLDAINRWRVLSVVEDDGEHALLIDAVRKAHDLLETEVLVGEAGHELRDETTQLEEVVSKLRLAQEHLLHAERLTTMGRITEGLTVAMRSHLAELEAFERLTHDLESDPYLEELIGYARDGIESISVLLDQIHAFAHDHYIDFDLSDQAVAPLLERALGFARFDRHSKQRVIDLDLRTEAHISADRHRLNHVFLNLLRNAFQATEPGDRITVRAYDEPSKVIIEVTDTGCGMTEETAARVFDSFFSTKGDHGMGLGLQVATTTIERHGGQISVHSELGLGTTFRIQLPTLHCAPS